MADKEEDKELENLLNPPLQPFMEENKISITDREFHFYRYSKVAEVAFGGIAFLALMFLASPLETATGQNFLSLSVIESILQEPAVLAKAEVFPPLSALVIGILGAIGVRFYREREYGYNTKELGLGLIASALSSYEHGNYEKTTTDLGNFKEIIENHSKKLGDPFKNREEYIIDFIESLPSESYGEGIKHIFEAFFRKLIKEYNEERGKAYQEMVRNIQSGTSSEDNSPGVQSFLKELLGYYGISAKQVVFITMLTGIALTSVFLRDFTIVLYWITSLLVVYWFGSRKRD